MVLTNVFYLYKVLNSRDDQLSGYSFLNLNWVSFSDYRGIRVKKEREREREREREEKRRETEKVIFVLMKGTKETRILFM